MDTQVVTLTALKHRLGEIVNRVAYRGDRIVLLSRGKARAALISLEDLHRLEALEQAEQQQVYFQRQEALLDEARALRERMARAGESTDSVETLGQIRQERLDELTGLR